MSVTCPSCTMESPEGAAYCDFCKEPFVRKEKPKEKLPDLPPEELLKRDLVPAPALPNWVRPLAYSFLALSMLAGALALWQLQQRYQDRRESAPAGPSGVTGRP